MYFKQKLAYMALGCLFTIIGYISMCYNSFYLYLL